MLKKLFYKEPAYRAGREKGITLVEVIIATFILLVAIIGSYLAFTQILIATSSVSDRLVAAYLTQEGVEVIRNIRDTNWLRQATDPAIVWDDILNTCPEAGCQVDYKKGIPGTPITFLDEYSNTLLNIDSSGFYTYDMVDTGDSMPTTPTKFKRKITITPDDDKLDVLVEVIWESRGQPYSFAAEEILYNWR